MVLRVIVYSVRIRPPQPKFLRFQSFPETPQPSKFVCGSRDSRKLRLKTLPISHDGHKMIYSLRLPVIGSRSHGTPRCRGCTGWQKVLRLPKRTSAHVCDFCVIGALLICRDVAPETAQSSAVSRMSAPNMLESAPAAAVT